MPRRRRNPDGDDYLYHVTFYSALPSIEEHGLQPGRGRGIGGDIYDTHRQGAIFLTDADGVRFWVARAEQWGHYQSDNLYEDELVPVLLRVRESDATRCELDEIGSRDARADAFKCRSSIDPEDLQLWAGVQGEGKWVDLEDFDEIPFADAFDPEDDEDGETIWWLKGGGGGSPLVPTELNPRRGRRAARRPGRARRRMRSP